MCSLGFCAIKLGRLQLERRRRKTVSWKKKDFRRWTVPRGVTFKERKSLWNAGIHLKPDNNWLQENLWLGKMYYSNKSQWVAVEYCLSLPVIDSVTRHLSIDFPHQNFDGVFKTYPKFSGSDWCQMRCEGLFVWSFLIENDENINCAPGRPTLT